MELSKCSLLFSPKWVTVVDIDWCCFFYSIRNGLVASLEALFARFDLSAWSLLSWYPTHSHPWVRLSVCLKLFALHCHGHAEWLGLFDRRSDKGFVIWHFVYCWLLQTISLWSLSIWILIILNANDLVSLTRRCKCLTDKILVWNKKRGAKIIKENASQARCFRFTHVHTVKTHKHTTLILLKCIWYPYCVGSLQDADVNTHDFERNIVTELEGKSMTIQQMCMQIFAQYGAARLKYRLQWPSQSSSPHFDSVTNPIRH